MESQNQPDKRDDLINLPTGTSRTLFSGMRVLDFICDYSNGSTIAEISAALSIDRTAVHRIVRTLALQDLIVRDNYKRYRPGWKLVAFGESVQSDLRSVSKPILLDLARISASTSHLVIPVGDHEAMALDVVQPENATAHVSFKAGQRHSRDRGSAGMALLAGHPPVVGERPEITEAREKGYAVSKSEVVPSMFGISAAVHGPLGDVPASIGISVFNDNNIEDLAAHVQNAALELGRNLRLTFPSSQ